MSLEQSRESFKARLPRRDKVETMICARINTHITDNANIKGRVVLPTLFLLLFRFSGVVVKYKGVGSPWDQVSINE